MAKAPYTLYTYFRSTAAHRARIALNLKGIPYECKYVNLLKKENRDSSIEKVNPFMKLPILAFNDLEQGFKAPIFQSTAIIEYLNDVYPDPPFFPQDPYKKAQIRAFINEIACDFHPLYANAHMDKIKELMTLSYGSKDDEYKAKWMKEGMTAGLSNLEKVTSKTAGKFTFGNKITMADIYLVPQIKSGLRWGVDLDSGNLPTLSFIFKNTQNLDAFKKASPEEQKDSIL